MLLVDTSVWIAMFRRKARFDLESQVDFEEVVVCLPVLQEVLQGFRDEPSFRLARESLLSLPMIESPLSLPVYETAVDLYRVTRRSGITLRSSVDCLIAACALRHGLPVLHDDRDFDEIAKVSSLVSRRIHAGQR